MTVHVWRMIHDYNFKPYFYQLILVCQIFGLPCLQSQYHHQPPNNSPMKNTIKHTTKQTNTTLKGRLPHPMVSKKAFNQD